MKIISGTDAQNFIRITDATIPPPSSAELSKIEFAIQQAIDILPNADKPLFKVYDIGFYVHNDNINSGVSPIWEKIKTETESDPISDYYLIFGRESNNNRQDSKIRVKLKLPSTIAFNCLSNEERENIEKYIEQVANDKKNVGYINAELTSLDLLKDYLYKTIKCNCSSNGPNCSQFTNFSFLDLQLKGLGFRKKEIKVGGNSSWVNGTQEIYDYFGKKVFIDGVEYNIADQVSEGKAIIEAQIQVLPDTVINTSISGKVYILDNQSFTNGEWNNAKSEAILNDYVEYWVILTNSTGNSFLYSRFTVGGGLTPVAAKGEIGSRGIVVAPPTPWGLALKAIGNAAIDAVMQTLVIRIVDTEVHDWGTAWNKVSYLGAAWEGVSSLIPWKKDLLSGVVRAATSAFAVVLDRALRIPDYTVNQGIVDFSIGFAASGITQLIFHPKTISYVGEGTTVIKIVFTKGIDRIYFSTTQGVFKKILFKVSKLTDDYVNSVVHAGKYFEQNAFITGIKKIDLMGGSKSQIGGEFINIDFSEQITNGIRGDATILSKFIPSNSIDEVICTNPYLGKGFKADDYIKEIGLLLKSGKKAYINGTLNNPFFNKINNALADKYGFVIQELEQPLFEQFHKLKFFQTNGTVIENQFMRTTVLVKK